MEAKQAASLPDGAGWQFEPKWDGFRCLAFRAGGAVDLRSRSGKPLGRFFPEVVDRLARLPGGDFVVDGELVIQRDGQNAFDSLQHRLHPAQSRIQRLARESPAELVLFDCLSVPDAPKLLAEPFVRRREILERSFDAWKRSAGLSLTWFTRDRVVAQGWLDRLEASLDGVVCKRLDDPYKPGERAMLKVKRLRTIDCAVGGFRYASGAPVVGSLLLGLYDARGRLNHIGFTSSIAAADRPVLTRRLEALIEPPGFTGDSPGGPSRWSTERSTRWQPLRPEIVVEVQVDHVSAGRFRHGARLIRFRPDKRPDQCSCDQLEGGGA